ncbi:DUF3105 domain-containing protein [Granulicoccus phenolivorans]|uniref:DUF3105 domain-containing protein n=1 Tax=Granulicoccus phenolivorans TaxID=266854 RepID=UPI000423C0FD|nr:DUF3105 domain-containing protein [Granulicoccus phenolivorans]
MALPGKSRRQQLREQQLAAARKQKRNRLIVWSSVIVVAALVITGATVAIVRTVGNRPVADMSAVQKFDNIPAGQHTEQTVNYPQTPPVGGAHRSAWLNCGIYDQPVPNENAVHALEHGAVWVTYRPDLPADQVERLRAAVPSTYMVVSPYPGIDAPVIASAWGYQLKLDGVDDPRLQTFIQEYRLGPQTPEPGAACTGAVDAPGKLA